ncbi:MAG: hypothetical protein ABA06_03125 [Parcubacteria bacterium C7867-001]|nr:MAG: hypothetical protein ABA06_03125 [Parcubacteria bacterium C7867-001]
MKDTTIPVGKKGMAEVVEVYCLKGAEHGNIAAVFEDKDDAVKARDLKWQGCGASMVDTYFAVRFEDGATIFLNRGRDSRYIDPIEFTDIEGVVKWARSNALAKLSSSERELLGV